MFEFKVALTSRLLLKLACRYFAVKLGITDEQFEMINIQSAKRLSGNGGNCGGVYKMDGTLYRIDIKILQSASDIGMIDVLAHEMVHAKQHLDNEFSFQTRTVPFLKYFQLQQTVKVHKGQILEDTPYYERLCEQEAFSKSRELTRQFLNFVNQLENLTDPNILQDRRSHALSSH